jgi:NhaP-type Na+/H+ or K+/H+ antiporter
VSPLESGAKGNAWAAPPLIIAMAATVIMVGIFIKGISSPIV